MSRATEPGRPRSPWPRRPGSAVVSYRTQPWSPWTVALDRRLFHIACDLGRPGQSPWTVRRPAPGMRVRVQWPGAGSGPYWLDGNFRAPACVSMAETQVVDA